MQEAQIKSVALFYFFTFVDKSLALKATTEALHLLDKKIKDEAQLPLNANLVSSTHQVWKKYSKKTNFKTHDLPIATAGWILPEGIKIEKWRQFVKDTEAQIYLSVIWSHLLQISEEEIALGVRSSPGSIRYRVGRGLKMLGQIASPSGAFDAQT